MPKAVILDGNSLLYRGFFAMRALSTSDRTPTNAVYALTQMILSILDTQKPDLIFAPFDPPAPTFRHIELATYKANRAAAPDDLRPQKPLARDLCRAFNIPVIEVEGYEADDVIGTLAERAKIEGFDVLVVTGDTDALQLVDDDNGPTRVMMTSRGVSETVVYDGKAVFTRYGLTPAQIPDYKSLKGDSSDNLPGVPGIGDKGASKLLAEFGTVENLLEHLDQAPEKLRAVLGEHRDSVLQCKRLATIVRDVALPEDLSFEPVYSQVGPDYPVVRELFERLEFRTLLKRLPSAPAPSDTGSLFDEPALVTVKGPKSEIHEITDAASLAAAFAALKDGEKPIGIAFQTTVTQFGLSDAAISSTAISDGVHAYHVPWPEHAAALAPYLVDAGVPKSIFDVKSAAAALSNAAVNLAGVIFDPLLAAYLLNAGRSNYPLEDLVSEHLGWALLEDATDSVGAVCDRAAAAAALVAPMRERLTAGGMEGLNDSIELPLGLLLARIELAGVSVDKQMLSVASADMAQSISRLEGEIAGLAGESFSIGSTKQLQLILFEKLKLPSGKKTKTGYSTGAEVLEELNAQGYEIAGKVLAWRELSKLKSTYADSLPQLVNPRTGRIHTSLNQTVASTGRLSSSNPNLQNIPIRTTAGQEIRRAFTASEGNVLVSADYSQIELRIFAHLTGEPALLEAFAKEEDVHEHTARMIFGIPDAQSVSKDQRRQAKTVNFAVLYGAGPFRVAAELGIPQGTASELIKTYMARYPGVRRYHDEVVASARETGFVQTMFGRRRYIPDILSTVHQFRQAAEREAANMPIQGACADIMKMAMLSVDSAMQGAGLSSRMILQVHDELLFDCPQAEVAPLASLVRTAMEGSCSLNVPLRCEVKSGNNWWDVTDVEGEPDELS